MAPSPENNSRRWWLDYSTCGHGHSLLMRSLDEVEAPQASTAMAAFLDGLLGQLYLVTIEGFRTAAKSSNISVPATWGGASTYGSGAGEEKDSANFINFVGRTANGKRSRAGMFGAINSSLGGNYRVTSAESAFVADAIEGLNTDTETWLGIDEFVPIWHTYANIGPSAYWRNKIR